MWERKISAANAAFAITVWIWYVSAVGAAPTVPSFVWNAVKRAPTARMKSAKIAGFAALVPTQTDSV